LGRYATRCNFDSPHHEHSAMRLLIVEDDNKTARALESGLNLVDSKSPQVRASVEQFKTIAKYL
jgi:hypothetical protein